MSPLRISSSSEAAEDLGAPPSIGEITAGDVYALNIGMLIGN